MNSFANAPVPQWEPFLPPDKAAKFLGISRRLLLAMARKGIKGAYPIGCGDFRKRWVFKISELAAAIDPKFDPRWEQERRKQEQEERDRERRQKYHPDKGSPR